MNQQGRLKGFFSIKYFILIFLTSAVIFFDQLTKQLILQKFRLGQSIPIITDYFSLTYVQNKGAAFGMLAQADASFRIPFFIIVPVVALASIGLAFKKIPEKDIHVSSSLSLIIAGAIGNLIDRIRFGYVVDFLDFHWKWAYHFPAFNVADSAICIGVGLLIIDLLTQEAEANAVEKGE